mgnify:FL=1
MFLINNMNDRDHRNIYPADAGESPAIFDLSEKQIASAVNEDWQDLKPGDIVTIITSSKKLSSFYVVKEILDSGVEDEDGKAYIIRGYLIAKSVDEMDFTYILNQHGVSHKRLPDNKFSIGFNIANLGNQLDELPVKTRNGLMKLKDLAT